MESRKTCQKDCVRSQAAYLSDISRTCDTGQGKGRCGERKCFLESVPACRAARVLTINAQGRKRRQYGTERTFPGRRAVGHRRRGRSDTYGYPRLSAHRAAHRPSPKKVIQGGAKAAAQRGETGARRNIPAGFCDREEVCVFETGLHLRRCADGGISDRGGVGLFVPCPSPQGAAVGLLRGPAARAQGRGRPGTAQQSAAGPLPPLHHGGADRVFPRRAPYPFL